MMALVEALIFALIGAGFALTMVAIKMAGGAA